MIHVKPELHEHVAADLLGKLDLSHSAEHSATADGPPPMRWYTQRFDKLAPGRLLKALLPLPGGTWSLAHSSSRSFRVR